MKAVVLETKEKLVYKDIETPRVKPGYVLVNVAYCGICGSDMPRVFADAAHNFPIVLGHEFSGKVVAVGSGVEKIKVGDHVVGAPLIPCFECEDCKNGNYSLCKHYSFVGSRQQGAFAEYVLLPKENIVKISSDISYEQASTIEPASVAYHAFTKVKDVKNKNVAIFGCGIIGLYAIQFAKVFGAKTVVALGVDADDVEAAKNNGADYCVNLREISISELVEKYEYASDIDIIIDCAGAPASIVSSFELVKRCGMVCYIGTPKSPVSFTVKQWENINRKEICVTGTWMSYSKPFPGKEWTDSIDLMKKGKLLLNKGMVGMVKPFEEAYEAFESIKNGKVKGRVLLKNPLFK